ncbi:FtsK/SpoIIIE domain-containing protein [Brachybacterium vulturis]|nr:FtsK/SpoIIIE domain-containing protein [Brachybacterium vulturis]
MAQKYDKPAWNYTGPLLALTLVATAAALVFGLPAGWVAFAGLLVTACAHPAPVLTGPKGTPDNSREELLVFQHRIWLDIRNSLLLGNRWGWRWVWPGYPPRTAFFVSAATGALVAALPLSGQVPTMVLGAIGTLVGWDAPVVEMPWQVAFSSGLLTHHVLTAQSTLLQRFASRPDVTIGVGPLRQMWSSTARPVLLIALPLAIAGAWATGWGLEQLGQEGTWRRVGMAAGFVLTLNIVVGPYVSRIRLRRWRSVKEAEAAWEPRFAEVFTAKEGTPRIVERTIAPCGAIVDVVDAPPKLMASGLQGRAEVIQAAYGDPSTRIDVLASPNLDAAGKPVAGTAHQLRVRIVQWPEGSFPNLLDPDLDTLSRDLALEAALARALDAIGVNRMVLVEAKQVADMPARVDPRLSGLAAKREQHVRAQIAKLSDDDGEEIARLEATLEEPVEAPRTSPLMVAWRWLRGVPAPPLVTPDDSPLAIWKTTWAMPGIPTPPWASIQAEHAGIGSEASIMVGQEKVEVDAVVERRQGFILVGDPVSDDSRYSEESGLELAQVRNVQAEIEWEQRWEQALPQGAEGPTTRFEITRTAELSQRFAREPLVLHEQLFATKTGLDAGETYIDPRGKDFEKGMRTSITAAQMVSLVGWPAEKEGQGSRHPHLFLVRWSTQPVPTTPQDVTPDDSPGPVATSGPAWVLAHQVNTAFRAPAVKLPKPEIVEAEPLTVSASSKHAWKVTIRLHGGTTLVDVRKKADAIRSQLACPWMRIQSASDGQVTLFIGDPGGGAKLRRGADVQIRRVDFDQAFVDSTIANTSGAVPALTALERLETNDQVEVLDFDLPAGIDAAKVRGNREKLRSNLGVEFLDVRKRGASSVRLFTSEQDPLPERVGIPFDDIAAGTVPFGVNALGEQMVFDLEENPHLLILGATGSGKSATISTQLHGLIRTGCDVVIIDPTKGGHDFAFAKDWAIAPFAGDVYQAASTLKALYAELERRKALLGEHGQVKIGKLPERMRPPRIVVVIDEFTSLIGKSQVPPKSEDPAADHARLEVEAENNARAIVGSMVGKFAREARFVGIHLILGTQKLTSKSLDSVPGSSDLKTNLARMGQGNMTQGDRMSAFRNPLEADSIAEPKIGRGLFEPLNAAHPVLMQAWYEENHTLRENLTAAGVEPVPDERMLDPTDPRYAVAPLKDFVDVVEETVEQAPVVEDIDLNLGEFDLGALLAESDRVDPADQIDLPGTDVSESEEAADPGEPADAALGGCLSLSGLDVGGGSWQLVQSLQAALATADVDEVIADVDGLDEDSEVGVSYRELIAEVASEAGAQLREATPTGGQLEESDAAAEPEDSLPERDEDGADGESADPNMAGGQDDAEEPAVTESERDPGQDLEDGFDFSFPAPPMVRGGL